MYKNEAKTFNSCLLLRNTIQTGNLNLTVVVSQKMEYKTKLCIKLGDIATERFYKLILFYANPDTFLDFDQRKIRHR